MRTFQTRRVENLSKDNTSEQGAKVIEEKKLGSVQGVMRSERWAANAKGGNILLP